MDPGNISPSVDQTPPSFFDARTTDEKKAKFVAFTRTLNFLHKLRPMHERNCEMSSDPWSQVSYDE